MVGIDLGDHDADLRLGHRVTLEARERGAFIRPLGDTVVLMPPLSISEEELRELMAIARRVDPRRRRLQPHSHLRPGSLTFAELARL